jgi:hypothetical protein
MQGYLERTRKRMTMKYQNQLIRQTAAVFLSFGLIAGLWPARGFADEPSRNTMSDNYSRAST